MKLAGCVILYNPDNGVYSNILTYIDEVSVLFIVDNSEVYNTELIDKLLRLPKIVYINNNGNEGVARALNIAVTKAFNTGYEWILTMDQDSSFINTRFFKLLKISDRKSVGIMAASHKESLNKKVKFFSEEFYVVDSVITSGNVLNIRAWRNINGFEEKLFIDEVDHDFCLRLKKNGYKILGSKGTFMTHVIGENINGASIKHLSSRTPITGHSPLRTYYMFRNGLFLCYKFFFQDVKFCSSRLYYLMRIFFRIIFYYPNKKAYIRFLLLGVKDFFRSRYGKLSEV